MTRQEIHITGLELALNNKATLFEWCTGLGKTLGAINVQDAIKANLTYVVVAETAHIKNWEDEYIKHGKKHLLKNTKIFCYASLKNYVNTECDLIILDELQHASELRRDYLNQIKYKKVVGLSATIGKDQLEELSNIFGKIAKHKVTTKQAIEYGILPEPQINLIPIYLDNTKRTEQIIQTRGNKSKLVYITCNYADRWIYLKDKKNYPNLELTISCTQYEKNIHYNEQIAYYKRLAMYGQPHNKIHWLRLGSERKRFLGECKTQIVKQFLKTIKEQRYIVFCTSIKQAKELGKLKNTIHSEQAKSLEIIDDFNNKKIDQLFTIGMLQEGQNLVDIEAGVIIQLDGQIRPYIQKLGRILRGKEPVMYIFYYENTQDKNYLNKILEEIPEEYIKYINL